MFGVGSDTTDSPAVSPQGVVSGHVRDRGPSMRVCAAAGCRRSIEGKRSGARFCSDTCRKRSRRRAEPAVVVELGGDEGGDEKPLATGSAPREPEIVAVYRSALVDAGRLETPLGQHVLVLARKMVGAAETGSGVAALSRQLDAVFDKAMKGVARGDSLDEFTKRLQAKRAAARDRR